MRRSLFIALFCIGLLATVSEARAQGCSLCTKTASNLDSKSAKGLNGGILYLAAMPLGILGTIGFIWWRRNKTEI
jgi:hypothetical protein